MAAPRDPRLSNEALARAVRILSTPGPADGLEAIEAGIIHTNLDTNALVLVRPGGTTKTLVQDPPCMARQPRIGQGGEL